MTTFIELLLEVTDGDDLAFEDKHKQVAVVLSPMYVNRGGHVTGVDVVEGRLVKWNYVPEEEVIE